MPAASFLPQIVAWPRRCLMCRFRRLFDPYHPERHYMRGPGPKCREKNQTRSAD
jgi:hypothetical protein